MGSLAYLFAAYAIIWVAMFVYSFSIGNRQKSIEREIEMLKAVVAEKEGSAAPQM